MAATTLSRVWRILGWAVAVVIALLAAVGLAAWVGSSLPRNPAWREPADGIEIMIGTNGLHTEIVLPLVTPERDWRRDLPASDVAASSQPYTHVAVSWGEREVFLNTPTWADLRPGTALKAMTGGDALLHVAHYVRPAPGIDNRPLRLNRAQYRRLVARIERALPPPGQRVTYPGYGDWDVFYDSPGRYDWRNTCNQWTGDTLAAAGVRIGRWTPFAGGLMKWIPEPDDGRKPKGSASFD